MHLAQHVLLLPAGPLGRVQGLPVHPFGLATQPLQQRVVLPHAGEGQAGPEHPADALRLGPRRAPAHPGDHREGGLFPVQQPGQRRGAGGEHADALKTVVLQKLQQRGVVAPARVGVARRAQLQAVAHKEIGVFAGGQLLAAALKLFQFGGAAAVAGAAQHPPVQPFPLLRVPHEAVEGGGLHQQRLAGVPPGPPQRVQQRPLHEPALVIPPQQAVVQQKAVGGGQLLQRAPVQRAAGVVFQQVQRRHGGQLLGEQPLLHALQAGVGFGPALQFGAGLLQFGLQLPAPALLLPGPRIAAHAGDQFRLHAAARSLLHGHARRLQGGQDVGLAAARTLGQRLHAHQFQRPGPGQAGGGPVGGLRQFLRAQGGDQGLHHSHVGLPAVRVHLCEGVGVGVAEPDVAHPAAPGVQRLPALPPVLLGAVGAQGPHPFGAGRPHMGEHVVGGHVEIRQQRAHLEQPRQVKALDDAPAVGGGKAAPQRPLHRRGELRAGLGDIGGRRQPQFLQQGLAIHQRGEPPGGPPPVGGGAAVPAVVLQFRAGPEKGLELLLRDDAAVKLLQVLPHLLLRPVGGVGARSLVQFHPRLFRDLFFHFLCKPPAGAALAVAAFHFPHYIAFKAPISMRRPACSSFI